MANWKGRTSSDAARALGCEYDVFLNFRGEDTRHNFTDFLYERLVGAGVHTFRDEEKLPVGDIISNALQDAINNSKLYIPIFSRNYASSKWCLRELKIMVDNVSTSKGQNSILPIFLLVKPDHVKLKTAPDGDEPYKAAFLEHEKKFPDEVEAWKAALQKVDEHKGWVVDEKTSQATTVKSVVKEVLKKLKIKQKRMPKHLVGLDDRVNYLTKLLDVKQDNVLLLGIYGMGGIGKTIIAKKIFNDLCSHFGKHSSFLESIRERLTKGDIVKLQKQLLSDVGGSESTTEKVRNDEEGLRRIEATLSNKRVLVVLDDVDKKEDIEKLIGINPLYSGSRIIITTRNKSTLEVEGFKGKILPYEMLKMADDLALQLFYRHALAKGFPSGDYHQLSSEIVSEAGGLPLAIREIGKSLNGKNQEFWKKTLVTLTKVPEDKTMKNLRISYDALDKQVQQSFLDIASFFFKENKDDASYLWADLYVEPIEVLIDRCMIKILDNDKIWMHNQLKYMGWQIIREESPRDPGKQSRLWIAEEALGILETEEMKDKVEALQIEGSDDTIEITNEKLKRLTNLRILRLCNGTFTGDFEKCHSQLRWISWQPPFRKFEAKDMHLDHLVVFKLGENEFTNNSKAWDLFKSAKKLKVLSLTDCDSIATIPDFSKCSGLERLTLQRCNRLKNIKGFMENPRSLIKLEIEWCSDLTDLPEGMGALVNLKRFSLRGCPGLKQLPSSLGYLTSLTELDLSGTGITELPNSLKGLVKLKQFLLTDTMITELPNFLGKLTALCELCLSKDGSYSPEDHVWQLPNGIERLKNLKKLDLSGRDEMKGEIHVGIGELSSLRILNLKKTRVCGIPSTINMLDHLETLNLLDCHEIRELPMLPPSLTCLLVRSNSLRSLPNLSSLTNLVELGLSDGSSLTNKSDWITGCDLSWIGRLPRLKRLKLDLRNVPVPAELASLPHLERLTLGDLDLKTLERLPSSLLSLELQFCSIRWAELSTLLFSYSEAEDIPLDELSQLEDLSIPSKLGKLRQATVSSCPELVDIQIAGPSESLESFFVYNCKALTRICGLSYLKKLHKLEIGSCNALINVEGLNKLESLRSLKVSVCKSSGDLIVESCALIPDDCLVHIFSFGELMDYRSKCRSGISLKCYREEILLHTLNFEFEPDKTGHPFATNFWLQINQFGPVSSEKWGKKKDVAPHSVTNDPLFDGVEEFFFDSKKMWDKTPGKAGEFLVAIKSGEQVKEMVQLASEGGPIPLIVEGSSSQEAVKRLPAFFLPVVIFLFLLFLRGKLDFPRKIRQLAGLRLFNHWEHFVVIVVWELFIFFVFTIGLVKLAKLVAEQAEGRSPADAENAAGELRDLREARRKLKGSEDEVDDTCPVINGMALQNPTLAELKKNN